MRFTKAPNPPKYAQPEKGPKFKTLTEERGAAPSLFLGREGGGAAEDGSRGAADLEPPAPLDPCPLAGAEGLRCPKGVVDLWQFAQKVC